MPTLHDYQHDAVAFIHAATAAHGACLLADEMGVGKSPPMLCAPPEGAPVLLVVPAALKPQTVERAKLWRGRDAVPFDGVGSFRMPRHGEWLVANPELLPAAPAEVARAEKALAAAENGGTLDLGQSGSATDAEARLAKLAARGGAAKGDVAQGTWLVVDECHEYNTANTAQGERMRALVRAVLGRGGRVVGVTATPLVNDPADVRGLLATFRLGGLAWPAKTGRSLDNFAFLRDWGGGRGVYGETWDCPIREAAVGQALRRVMLRRLFRAAVPSVPPLRAPETIQVDLDADARRLADGAEGALRERLADLALGKGEKVAFEAVSRVRAAMSAAKALAAARWCDDREREGEPARVWTVSVDLVRAIARRDGWAAITGETPYARRHEILRSLAAGNLRGIVGTIAAGGVGTDEQTICEVLFADREWNPTRNRQALARSYRAGQKRQVRPWFLRAAHPMEDRLDELLEQRRRYMRAIDAAAVAA